MIKAIETEYKGYRFRSRLEARWAVFFDALGVEWEYEKEGYELPDVGYYLPDFFIKKPKCWIEIKPFTFDEKPYNDACEKAGVLAFQSNTWVNMICGEPWPGKYIVTAFRSNNIPSNLMKYIDLAIANNERWMLQKIAGGYYLGDILETGKIKNGWDVRPSKYDPKKYRTQERNISFCEHHKTMSFGYMDWFEEKCPECNHVTTLYSDSKRGYCFDEQDDLNNPHCEESDLLSNSTITRAYNAARSARFEHGEKGYKR